MYLMITKIIPVLLFSYLLVNDSKAQSQTFEADSLMISLKSQKTDTAKVQLIIKVAKKFLDNDIHSLRLYAKKALDLSNQINYELGKAESLHLYGVALNRNNELDSAQHVFQSAYLKFKALGETEKMSNSQYSLGVILFKKSALDSAINHFSALVESTTKDNIQTTLSKALLFLGIIYSDQGNPIRATNYYQRSLKIAEAENNTKMQSMLLNNLSSIHFYQEDFPKSLFYLEKSLALLGPDLPSRQKATTIRNIGISKLNLDRPKEALIDTKKSYDMLLEIKEKCPQSFSLMSISDCLFKLFQYDSALSYSMRSIAIARSCNEKPMIARALKRHGETLVEIGKYNQAIKVLDESYKLSTTYNFFSTKKTVAGLLYKCYRQKQNNAKAITYLERFHELKDSIINEKNTKQIARLESQFEFEKEKVLYQLASERKTAELQNKVDKETYYKLIAIVVLLAVSLLALILFLFYRNKKKANKKLSIQNQLIKQQSIALKDSAKKEKELLEDQIKLKQKELAALAINANEKNNILKSLEEKLKKMNIDETNTGQVKEIRKLISNNIKKDDSWDSFVHKFEDIHPNFFQKLKEEFLKLTLNELKICGYIKIGMSNPEIMELTNIAPASVKKNLSRIKKKLLLGPEDSIRGFLISYE